MSAPAGSAGRLAAVDWLRGVVMVLMTVDHASAAFDAGHLVTDGIVFYKPGTPLDPAEFLVRWATHLCAPAFLFLAGVSLALSVARQTCSGVPARAIDRHLLLRGAVLVALDPLWMSFVMGPDSGNVVLLQVLYAIGSSFVCMIGLRRLPARALLIGALVLAAGSEAAIGVVMWSTGGHPPLAAALLFNGGFFGRLAIGYPLVPWLVMLVLGWCCGFTIRERWADGSLERRLATAGAASLGVFAIVRGANAYGNMLLVRDDGSLVQWLHVSKYPPSVTFTALEFGLACLLLAGLFRLERRGAPRFLSPLAVLGRTPLFYYVLHAHLLMLAAILLGLRHRGGLLTTAVATVAALIVLYPLCVRYDRYKTARPTGWARYL